MRLTYFGHSAFLLETSAHRLLFDPFFEQNPLCRTKATDIRCDFIFISHAHSDHCADALKIAQHNDAKIIANYEIADFFAARGAKTHAMNPGGGHDFPFGRAKLTPAIHTSSFDAEGPPPYAYGGTACGLLVTTDGRTIYHAGDTALFSDMKLIGDAKLDLALIPIGDNFTMGPDDAVKALRFLRPALTVPMHYNTWPIIAQDAAAFTKKARRFGHKVQPLQPGEHLDLPGTKSRAKGGAR
jgi:L-ascorbate metabolism protein UlaG (beta-lactamase superfamily)